MPDSGRFDVSAPGTPFASPDHVVDLRLVHEATRLRQPGGARPARTAPLSQSVHAVQEHERSHADRDHDQGEEYAEY